MLNPIFKNKYHPKSAFSLINHTVDVNNRIFRKKSLFICHLLSIHFLHFFEGCSSGSRRRMNTQIRSDSRHGILRTNGSIDYPGLYVRSRQCDRNIGIHDLYGIDRIHINTQARLAKNLTSFFNDLCCPAIFTGAGNLDLLPIPTPFLWLFS